MGRPNTGQPPPKEDNSNNTMVINNSTMLFFLQNPPKKWEKNICTQHQIWKTFVPPTVLT